MPSRENPTREKQTVAAELCHSVEAISVMGALSGGIRGALRFFLSSAPLLFLIHFSWASKAFAQTIGQVSMPVFASDVPVAQREQLRSDLDLILALDWQRGASQWAPLLELEPAEVSANVLRTWLLSRIRIVVGPDSVRVRPGSSFALLPQGRPHGSALMLNLGALVVDHWRRLEKHGSGVSLHQRSLSIAGLGWINVQSPRVGILQLLPAFGTDEVDAFGESQDPNEAGSMLASAWRLSVLFHEARHSDGRANNAGFPHQPCPSGHAFAGVAACDSAANGPYRMGAMLLEVVLEAYRRPGIRFPRLVCTPQGQQRQVKSERCWILQARDIAPLTALWRDSLFRIQSPGVPGMAGATGKPIWLDP